MRTALYRHFDRADQLLYVGISVDPVRRMAEHCSRSSWFKQIARVSVEWLEDRKLALAAERRAILGEQPKHNATPNEKPQGAAVFIDAFGKEELAEYFGVTFNAVRNAHWRDRIPASWAHGIALICRDRGLYCPVHAFGWKGGGGNDPRCISTIMFDTHE